MGIPVRKGQFFSYSLMEGDEATVKVTGDPVEVSYSLSGPFGDVEQTVEAGSDATINRPGMIRGTGTSEVEIVYPPPPAPESPDTRPPGPEPEVTP